MKKVLFQVIAVLIGLSIGLFLGEIISRVYIFGFDGLSYNKLNSFTVIGKSGHIKASDNQKVFYELKPNIDDYFKLKKFNTNAQGCRDKAYSMSKPKNTIRGVFIGDSFTMGSGVKLEDTYHSKLEKTLNQRSADIRYEFINCGVAGYNLLNYLGVLEEKAMSYDPDFLLIGICSNNDFLLPRKNHYNKKFKVKEKVTGIFWTSFFNVLLQRAFEPIHTSNETSITNEQVAFIDQMFNAYATISRKNNIPLLLTYLSIREDDANLPIIKSLAVKHKLPIADSNGKFDDSKSKIYQVNILDAHPNATGHEIFANTLLSFGPFQEVIRKTEH